MIGDMWNFVNLGKRVDGCEETLGEVGMQNIDRLGRYVSIDLTKWY